MQVSNLGHLSSFEFCFYLREPLEFWYWADDIIYIHKNCLIFRLYLIGLLLCIVSTEVHTQYSCYILPTHVQYMHFVQGTPWQLFTLEECTAHSSPIPTMWILMST